MKFTSLKAPIKLTKSLTKTDEEKEKLQTFKVKRQTCRCGINLRDYFIDYLKNIKLDKNS